MYIRKHTSPFLKFDQRVVRIFNNLIKNRVGVKAGEHVLIFGDTETELEIIQALATAVTNAGGVYTVLIQPGGGWNPSDPYAITKPAQKACEVADVIIGVTMSNSAAVYGGSDFKGEKTRFLSLGERPLDILMIDTADYDQIARNAETIAKIFEKGREVRITSRKGTDFTAVIDQASVSLYRQHKALFNVGFCRGDGEFGGAPDGEIHFGPALGMSEGTIVIDGPIANVTNFPTEPVNLIVKKGRIVSIEGGKEAKDLTEIIKKHKNANYVSEIGLGLNPTLPMVSGYIHPEKKALGNAHVAYGAYMGYTFGEHSEIEDMGPHSDMVIREAKFEVDGRVIVESAELKISDP